MHFPKVEIWGGIECTYNRVHNQYFDQMEYNGHLRRCSDLERFGELGIKKLRYPVSWERTAPDDLTKADWSWTDERLSRLRELGIEPIAGLVHHGSGPRYTSLLDPLFGEKLAKFALAVAERYPWLEAYTPINEPLTTARFSGLYGHWYPHGKDDKTFLTALINEIEATILSMRSIRQINPQAKLIQTEDMGKTFSTPTLKYQADFENERRWLSFDLLYGFVDEKHQLWKYLLQNGVSQQKLEWIKENKCPPDLIGINHYLTSERFLDEYLNAYPSCYHGGNGEHQYVDIEAIRVYPDLPGLKGLLREVTEKYTSPVAVTEVHLGCTREEQMRWLQDAWEIANGLKEEGRNIIAITAWSMLGSYDWNSLVTCCNGFYEPGIYDNSGSELRETALAKMLRKFSKGEDYIHPVLKLPGWWRRPERLIYNSPSVNRELTDKITVTKALLNKSFVQPILITGGKGTLGRAFAKICELRAIPYIALNREDLDIASHSSAKEAIEKYAPWALINAAGYVRVDDAEKDSEKCNRENIEGAINLASICESFKISFVTFSSDLVFDGNKESLYFESDQVNPLSVYGKSKAKAEKEVLAINPSALIIRASAFFGPWDFHNFITVVLQKAAKNEKFQAASDLIVSPTYVPDLVNACLDILIDGECGLWHLANQGEISWASLASKALNIFGLPENCLEVRKASEMNFLADRPKYCALGSRRGKLLPSLEDALERYKRELTLNSPVYV